jgi:hypothetical protein
VTSSKIIEAAMELKNRDNREQRRYVDERTLPLPGFREHLEEAGIATS